ncbi:MAG: GlxA family transcriptional regulator [Cohaesibacter sp.]|nr:GlxA family transcriptional regulator [Cohaesibacter sp.]
MRHFVFLLFDHFSNLCLANAIEPLRAANMKAGAQLYRWSLVSPTGGMVTSSSGLELNVDHSLDDVPQADIFFAMPSYQYRTLVQPEILRALRFVASKGVIMGGLDCGSHLLAKAGLLDSYRATIHWEEIDLFEERFLDVEVVVDRFVIDRDRITSGGGTTTLDLMLRLIREHHGALLANEVAGVFVYGHERPPSDPQWITPTDSLARKDPALSRILTLMVKSLEQPVPIAHLAKKSGTSQRALERLFQDRFQTTPSRYYQHLRLSKARGLLMESRLSVGEIAVRAGYRSTVAFTRAFKKEFGIQPSRLRLIR